MPPYKITKPTHGCIMKIMQFFSFFFGGGGGV